MGSHTGGAKSMGTGAVHSTSKKQKLNTKSSTEAELVGINDVLPQALWTKYFIEAQDYDVSTILNQDSQSTIKLSENEQRANRGTFGRPYPNRGTDIQCDIPLPIFGYFEGQMTCDMP
jgi:hypothetical protein